MKICLLILFVLSAANLNAQGVAINNDGSAPGPNSILDLKSTAKGVMLPRMTTLQRLAIPVQVADAGLLVFDTDNLTLYLYTGHGWKPIPFMSERTINPVEITASDVHEMDNFGTAVALYGNYAVVGAPYHDLPGKNEAGAVYVYQYNGTTWVEVQKITANDGAAQDYFGRSVAISATHIVVSSGNVDVNGVIDRGAAYVFVLNGNQWTLQAKLVAGDGLEYDRFGHDVAIDGDRIVVGAPGDDNGQYALQGSAYVFARNGNSWTQTNKLITGEFTAGDEFGTSVDISGNYIAIGAPGKQVNHFRAGAVFLFQGVNQSNWAFHQKLTDLSPEYEAVYGNSVSLDSNRLAVGVPGATVGNKTKAGKIIMYELFGGTWGGTNSLYAINPEEEASFGISVDVARDKIMAGASLYDEGSLFNSGAAWVYQKPSPISSWLYERKITSTEPTTIGFFGSALAVDKMTRRYIIGSYYTNNGRGSVHFGNIR